jgi:hypothetical protein
VPRAARVSVGEICYLVINRGNARQQVFQKQGDYQAFVELIGLACERIVNRGTPFGSADWVQRMAIDLGLEASLRPRGCPRNRSKKSNVPFPFPADLLSFLSPVKMLD